MDLAYVISLTTWLVLLSISGVHSATVALTKSAEKGQLGNNSLSLFCDYSVSAGEGVSYIYLKRKRSTDSSFVLVVYYYESSYNTSHQDGSDLVGRTVITAPTPSNRRAILQFNNILCTDEADYQCELNYISGPPKAISNSTRIVVTATPIFENQSLPYSPSSNLAENQNVTFTCTGNVGREPQGNFSWYKYFVGQAQGIPITNGIKPVSLTSVPGSCTFVRTETMTMTLTKEDNQMVMRCTVQQTTLTETGDGNIQTDHINVYYAPRINPIKSSPAQSIYYEGLPQLVLTSDADSNPPSNYVWILPDGTEKSGSGLVLTSLTTNHTGMYTFMAYTGWGGQNYTATSSINITVVATTTQPPTTTTTTTRSSSTVTSTKMPGAEPVGRDNKASADSTTGMIIGIVVGGVVVIAVIIIAIVCIKKRKKQEIEEPAEKPRNNRDLVFSGNRPDVVETNEKWRNNQNNQNINLNNSYDSSDSTKKGDGQLTYVDLQFDDKPRSRKPIQIIDSTPYADIAMPRV